MLSEKKKNRCAADSGSSSYSVFRIAKQITLMQRQSRHFLPVIAASVLQMGITATPQAPKLPPVHSCHPAARGKPQSRPARQESYQCCHRYHYFDSYQSPARQTDEADGVRLCPRSLPGTSDAHRPALVQEVSGYQGQAYLHLIQFAFLLYQNIDSIIL